MGEVQYVRQFHKTHSSQTLNINVVLPLFLHSTKRWPSEQLHTFKSSITIHLFRTSEQEALQWLSLNELICLPCFCCNRDSVVGIPTWYRLDDPVIEFQRGQRFSLPVQTGPQGPTSLLYHRSFPLVKQSRHCADHPSTCRAKIANGLELLLLIVENSIVQYLNGFHWDKTHTKLHKNVTFWLPICRW